MYLMYIVGAGSSGGIIECANLFLSSVPDGGEMQGNFNFWVGTGVCVL